MRSCSFGAFLAGIKIGFNGLFLRIFSKFLVQDTVAIVIALEDQPNVNFLQHINVKAQNNKNPMKLTELALKTAEI